MIGKGIRRGPRPRAHAAAWRGGYVLLETVIATGLLVVGIAVIGAQVQTSDYAIRRMERRVRAMYLAEQHLAEFDLGLIELDSLDEQQYGDFGPRFPDWGWWLTIQDTALEKTYLLTVDVYYHLREEPYREDDFDFVGADHVYTAYAMRTTPEPVNFAVDFGMHEEELIDLREKLGGLSIPGLDPEQFDPTILAKLDFEELVQTLPPFLEAMGMDPKQLLGVLPPDLIQQLEEAGILGGESDESADEAGGE
jgi:hypothetical protein